MIVTVTMNPAIDKTIEIEALLPGGLNRIQKVEYDAGGKGINVSKTIHELGGSSIAVGFLGGNAGKTIESVLNEWGINNDFIWVRGETRTNTKVYEKSGALTELNEPGPQISKEQQEELVKKLEGYANEETLFVLAGSIPNGVDKQIYSEIIPRVHAKGAKVLLDADGELFRNALKEKPDIIKPNRVELEEYFGFDYRVSMEELLEAARKLQAQGIETEKVLLRYAVSHIQELIDDEIPAYITEEMYISPPIGNDIKTGSIVQAKSDGTYCIVLSPPCDLAMHDGKMKTDRVLICEIDSQDEVNARIVDGIASTTKQAKKIATALNNNYTDYYHWLPQNTLFSGGYINFRKVITYSPNELCIRFKHPLIKVQESFVKSILGRFSAYYARQGQPDFNFDKEATNIVNKLPATV